MSTHAKPSCRPEERVQSLIRHLSNSNFTAADCQIHPKKPCLLLLNNYNEQRFHCLYANRSTVWKSYTIDQSCDIPEHFYEMMEMHKLFGSQYVLPFAGHLRESSGYTIGMFHQTIHLYPPRRLQHHVLKETAYALIVFFCAVCHQMGGAVPDLKQFLFLYTPNHPVLCDIGSHNVENRVRLKGNQPHMNEKKWRRVMHKKTIRDVIRYMKVEFSHFFNQKKKKGKRCVLDETEEAFDTETHELLCQSNQKSLVQVIQDFSHLMPDENIRHVMDTWVGELARENPLQC